MYILHAAIEVKAGQRDRFEALCRDLWDATHRRESGLVRYEYLRSESPNHYLTILEFDSYESFITHQASPHHIELAGAMKEIIVDMSIAYLNPVAGASGSHDNPATEPCTVGDEERRHYQVRYPAVRPSWW